MPRPARVRQNGSSTPKSTEVWSSGPLAGGRAGQSLPLCELWGPAPVFMSLPPVVEVVGSAGATECRLFNPTKSGDPRNCQNMSVNKYDLLEVRRVAPAAYDQGLCPVPPGWTAARLLWVSGGSTRSKDLVEVRLKASMAPIPALG
jgi:hypothetical protein